MSRQRMALCHPDKPHHANDQCRRCYDRDNGDKIRAQRRRYYQRHREEVQRKNREYYHANRERCRAQQREYAKRGEVSESWGEALVPIVGWGFRA